MSDCEINETSITAISGGTGNSPGVIVRALTPSSAVTRLSSRSEG